MHLVNPLFMDFGAKTPMHGHQVCSFTYEMDLTRADLWFDALRPIIIDCIVLDKEGLGESFMGLGKSGHISPSNTYVDGPDAKIEEHSAF